MAEERILIVDDEEDIRWLLERLCTREGYQVLTVKDGASARKALHEYLPSVCILDLRLPDCDGLDILRYAKQVRPVCEVIILTGHGDLETAVEALRLGAYDYLQKPIQDLQLLLIVISRALERQVLSQRNTQLLRDLQAANTELELRRRQQLQYINYIGHALSGSLKYQNVSRVLVQAILESINCDGAGVLLLHKNGADWPWIATGARKKLSPRARDELVAALMGHIPLGVCPNMENLEVHEASPARSEEVDEEPWRRYEFGMLAIRDDLEGVAVIASHRDEPFGEEAMGFFEIFITQGSTALANARLFARASELAARDGLTGLYNHRHFYELLDAEISRANRHGQELAVVMIDVDRTVGLGLKAVNDTYGHQAGDQVLRGIAKVLQGSVRRADVVARYGGDEFIILAPQTGKEEALTLAKRICERLRQHAFVVAEQELHLTVSIGVAVLQPGKGLSSIQITNLADRGLYLAKERGGDQACLVDDETSGCIAP